MKIFATIVLSFWVYFGAAQCFPDRHNTNWFDQWISCSPSNNPNADRGVSHWILYDFNHLYQLGQMHVWNINSPDFLDDGIKDVIVDISNDGNNWTEIGQFEFEMGTGSSIYEGFEGPNLSGYKAKYLLITGLSNHGGFCYGLSEIRVNVEESTSLGILAEQGNCLMVNLNPNPITPYSRAQVFHYCSEDQIDYQLQDMNGRIIQKGIYQGIGNEGELDLDLSQLQSGTYVLSLYQDAYYAKRRIVIFN